MCESGGGITPRDAGAESAQEHSENWDVAGTRTHLLGSATSYPLSGSFLALVYPVSAVS